MSKHTPGPFTAHSNGQWYGFEARFHEVKNAEGVVVAFVKECDDSPAEAKANECLFAAAPDLLEELEETHSALCFTADYIGTLRYERNKAAIAKARGEQP